MVVLSERAARTLFPEGEAIGRRIKLWGDQFATVVGIVLGRSFGLYSATSAGVRRLFNSLKLIT